MATPPPDLGPGPEQCDSGKSVGHPIIPATGEKVLLQGDYEGSGAAPLNFVRHYRSSRVVGAVMGDARAGLSPAWSHNYSVSLLQVGQSGVVGSTARILMGDGSARDFSWDATAGGWLSTNDTDSLVDNANGLLYKRQDDGSTWQFDSSGKLLGKTEPNGWVTTYTYSTSATPASIASVPGILIQVSNQFGRALRFAYNTNSQLISVTTPEGQVYSYQYDGTTSDARLTTVVFPVSSGGPVSKTYLYENTAFPQLLTGIIDENASRLATYAYDSQGRGISTQYAGGADQFTISYGAAATDPVQVTDPLGTTRTYGYGTQFGKLAVTGASLPSNAGTRDAASRVQNASGLIDSETDFLGVQTMYTWDINRRLPLSTTRAANKPEANTTTTQWHPTLHLPVLITEPKRSTAYTYDANGNKLSEVITDLVSHQTQTWSWTYNAQALVATATDPLNRTTTYAYYSDTTLPALGTGNDSVVSLLLHGDGANGSTTITDSSLSPQTIAVNGNAKISTTQNKFGGASLAFDGMGDYLSIPHSSAFDFGAGDFTIEMNVYINSYNPNDFVRLWCTDSNVVSNVYFGIGANGYLHAYMSVGGSAWDYFNQNIALLSLGQWHHVVLVRRAGSVYAYVDGVQYIVTSSLGTQALYSGNTTPRVIGGSSGVNRTLDGFIDEVRITKGQALYTSNFTPPTAAFADPVAVVVNASDTGHTIGDLQSITNPAGQLTTFNLYDRAGRVRQSTDPKGVITDTTYTPRGWVSSVTTTAPGQTARTTTYTYDNVGQLTGVLSPDGTSTTMSYDAAHRLVGASDAKGNSVAYTLDNMGNRIGEQIKDPSGLLQLQMQRSFDALNRVQQVKVGAP